MAAGGNRFESLSDKDVTTIFELYEATLSVAMMANAVEVPEAPDSVAEQQGSHPLSHTKHMEMKPPDLLPPASNLHQL